MFSFTIVTCARCLLWSASSPLLAGMVTPSVVTRLRSTFWMLWVSMELRRARLRPARNAPLHSILNIESIVI